MTIAARWLLPDGIEEILPPQAARIEALRRALLDEYQVWGFDLLQPPTAEYLESLLTGVGHDLDLLTFKITDQLNGRMMGVSADRTQQVARMDAHSIPKEGVARYCYCSQVLHTKATHLLSSRNPLQIGAELYGTSGNQSDLEIISLMLRSLEIAGLKDVTVDLGHVGIYQALIAEMSLTADQQAELYTLLRHRALPELAQWLSSSELTDKQQRILAKLPEMAGSVTSISDWKAALAGAPDEVFNALANLQAIAEATIQRFPNVNVHLDLAELRDYNYHTGMVFSAFVPGFGQPVARGGRYDHTGEVFGRSRPATGFSSDLKVLTCLTSLDWSASSGILAPDSDSVALQQKIQQLRSQGERVIQLFTGQTHIEELGCDRMLVMEDDQWQIQPLVNNGRN
ncbi:ATP phosphoribosyltransferase regulatory subunit [Reinekea marinisedimentorum]|uniref:ATP phosphoribosyltransferase regulatory subunit n=1 Tax=Reinekea marinisedimentorum TaxID=230495 RepID=A0A4R3IC79_9GAMM|nr:ATP phosphoribosyltransferase regulatory subunit [Reinekea marinisedimentorum]TCS42987.1 ATP phosphoribosyltransferase regulatory subunit [Reinekea marinisedimentorum]